MTTPELLPCPFCGGKAAFSLGKAGEGEDWHYLECAECEAMGPRVQYAAHNIAIKDALSSAWNTRAPTPDRRAALAAIESVAEAQAMAPMIVRDAGHEPTHDLAKIIQKRIDTIVQEEGSWEPDTNATNLPEWAQIVIEELESILAASKKGGV